MTTTNAERYYLFGAAIACGDPKSEIAAGNLALCVQNPKLCAVALDPFWGRLIMNSERSRELLARADIEKIVWHIAEAALFWKGFYQEKSGPALRTVNPDMWLILHPEGSPRDIATANYGDFLRKFRLEKKLTQAALAEWLGYATPTPVTEWESGRRLPSLPTAFEIAAALGKKVDDFRGSN